MKEQNAVYRERFNRSKTGLAKYLIYGFPVISFAALLMAFLVSDARDIVLFVLLSVFSLALFVTSWEKLVWMKHFRNLYVRECMDTGEKAK